MVVTQIETWCGYVGEGRIPLPVIYDGHAAAGDELSEPIQHRRRDRVRAGIVHDIMQDKMPLQSSGLQVTDPRLHILELRA